MDKAEQIKQLRQQARLLQNQSRQLQNQLDAESGKGLRCPGCGCGHFETEKTVDIPGRRRRRYKICRNCKRRVRTVEVIETE